MIYIYKIICNCIYSVVINCGWNNNVAVKIVNFWNWNVFKSSSWLDNVDTVSLSLLYMLDVIHLIVTILSDRPSFEWECNVTGRPIWFRPLKLTFSTCFRVVVAQQWHGRDAVWGFGKRTVGGARDGDWRWWLSRSTSHFYGSHKDSWKITATLCRLCELYCGLTVLKLIW